MESDQTNTNNLRFEITNKCCMWKSTPSTQNKERTNKKLQNKNAKWERTATAE